MLPLMSNLKTKLIAGTVAVALLATSAVPASAWDRDSNGHGGNPQYRHRQYGNHNNGNHNNGNHNNGNHNNGNRNYYTNNNYYGNGRSNNGHYDNGHYNNNGVLLGTGLGLLLGYGLGSNNNQYRQPVYAQPVYPAPVYRPPVYVQPVYPQQPVYQRPVYQQPVYQQQSIYNLPVAYAFQNLSWNERRRIQATLTNYGYYHGGLEGNFGAGTYDAILRYARNTGWLGLLDTQAGSAQVFARLLG